ncbi:MAG: nuclear transport factor 2 family protein [Bdellovibrionota bacterium]
MQNQSDQRANASSNLTNQTDGQLNETKAIEALIERFSEAFVAGDIERILKLYSPDVVAFDMMPPLSFNGIEEYKKAWEQAAKSAKAPWVLERKDEKIYTSGDIAFVHHLLLCGGTMEDGKTQSGWTRHTMGLKKTDGRWLIVHDQFSVPVDMKTGRGLMELKPEDTFETTSKSH